MKRVAINGFGRIGRAYFRLAHYCEDITIVAINDIVDPEIGAYLLQYDTVYGTFDESVVAEKETLHIGDSSVAWYAAKQPAELPWRALGIDVVIEATGVFASYQKAYAHNIAGANHTIITAPVKDTPPNNVSAETILVGVNDEIAATCSITSNASCTTNAVGIPLALLDETLGVESAILNTVHGYTASQQLVDGPTRKKNNLRSGRAAAVNIIPSSTGAAIATSKVLSQLENHFDGIALRVPVVAGSIADITLVTKKKTTVQEVNTILASAEKSLFTTTTDSVVSSDIIGMPFVSIADLAMTRVVNGNLVKVLLWYDNETGYTQSLIEHTRAV